MVRAELRPCGFLGIRGIRAVEEGVHEVEVVEFFEERGFGDRVAVPAVPLEVADPERHLGELERVGVDLEAVELPGSDGREERGFDALVGPEEDGFLFKVLEFLQGDVEEVAGPAGGVENMDAREADEERVLEARGLRERLAERRAGRRLEPGLRVLFSGLQEARDRGADGFPFATEWGDENRLDEILDVLASGVFRTERRAGGGVETALEERAEDRGIDRAPVEPRGLVDRRDLGRVEPEDDGVGEKPTVEMRDRFVLELATRRHRAEEFGGVAGEALGVVLRVFEQGRKNPVRQEPDILGEQAEHDPIEEPRRRLGVVVARAEASGQARERGGGFFRDRFRRAAGAQIFRLVEQAAEDLDISRALELGGRKSVDRFRRAGKIRVDLDEVGVADDEERRIFQRGAVAEDLVVGFGQIRVAAFVFEREKPALPDIRPPVAAPVLFRPALETKRAARRVGLRRLRMPRQLAEIEEMLLVGRPLGERNPRPFFDEVGWRNGHGDQGRE